MDQRRDLAGAVGDSRLRFGYNALNNADYDDIAGMKRRFKGIGWPNSTYELFTSVTSITSQRLANFRAAFPNAKLLAYIDVFHLEIPPGTISLWTGFHSSGTLTEDRWLKNVIAAGADTYIERFSNRGWYFWNEAMLTALTDWVVPRVFEYDGVFIDNSPLTTAQSTFSAIIQTSTENAVTIGDGNAAMSAAQLKTEWDAMSPLVTAAFRSALPRGNIIICNAGAKRQDANINGIAIEQDDHAIITSSDQLHMEPRYECQIVYEETRAAILRKRYPKHVILLQDGTDESVNGRLPNGTYGR